MVFSRIAEGFRTTVSSLRPLDGSFHTFSLPEDRCVRLLVKTPSKHMPEDVVRAELENLGICFQGALQLRSGRRDQEADKARPLTSHLIVSFARGPEVTKVRSLTELCVLRVSVKHTLRRKDPCSASAINASAIGSGTAGTVLGVLPVMRPTSQGSAPPHISSLSAVGVEETTQLTTGAMRNGKRTRRRLLCGACRKQ